LKHKVQFDAEEAMKRLDSAGVSTWPFFRSVPDQTIFQKMGLFEGIVCSPAERIARRGFYLHSGLQLSAAQIDFAAASLAKILSFAT
jgi:perosamine synthetase